MSEGREQRVLDALEQNRRPLKFDAPRIDMSHGAGGKATHKLIEGLLLPALDNPALAPLSDAALLPFGDNRLALTTDSFVVRPLVFPGGSIGELAVNGTVNDLAVSGATPIALSAALIVEEGLETEVLTHEVDAMATAAGRAGVPIATGDTKVVERGKGDGLYVITTGVGLADPELSLSTASVLPGDKILCSGTLGDHGAAILIARGHPAANSAGAGGQRSRGDGAALYAGSHTRRGGNGLERARPRLGVWYCPLGGEASDPGRRTRGVRDPRYRPALCGQRRQAPRRCRPGHGGRFPGGAAERRGR